MGLVSVIHLEWVQVPMQAAGQLGVRPPWVGPAAQAARHPLPSAAKLQLAQLNSGAGTQQPRWASINQAGQTQLGPNGLLKPSILGLIRSGTIRLQDKRGARTNSSPRRASLQGVKADAPRRFPGRAQQASTSTAAAPTTSCAECWQLVRHTGAGPC